jgi:hypothetical protein
MMGKILDELKKGQDAEWFQAVKPVPQPLKDAVANHAPLTEEGQKLVEQFGYSNWYDYCVAEWGTKWDAKIDRYEQDGDSIIVYFDTAWAPPEGIYAAMEEAGIQVEATYIEQGMGYMGYRRDGIDHMFDMPEYDSDDDGECSTAYYEAIDKVWEDAGMSHGPSNLGG